MTPIKLSRVEAPLRVTIQLLADFNDRDRLAMKKHFNEAIVLHRHLPVPESGKSSGINEVMDYFTSLFTHWPEIKLEAVDLFGMGNRSVLQWETTCSKQGMGQKTVSGVALFTLTRESITEIHIYSPGAQQTQ